MSEPGEPSESHEPSPSAASDGPLVSSPLAPPARKMPWQVYFFGALAFAMLVFLFVRLRKQAPDLPRYGQIPAFSMRDQHGAPAGGDTLRGKPFIADFIFTSCKVSCPTLTARMKSVQDKLVEGGLEGKLRLVSISVDPEHDTPEVLQTYATGWKAREGTWLFLTGKSEELDRIVVKGFKLQYEKAPDNVGIVNIMHGDWFVLVDKDGVIRGYYDTTVRERFDQILVDAKRLSEG